MQTITKLQPITLDEFDFPDNPKYVYRNFPPDKKPESPQEEAGLKPIYISPKEANLRCPISDHAQPKPYTGRLLVLPEELQVTRIEELEAQIAILKAKNSQLEERNNMLQGQNSVLQVELAKARELHSVIPESKKLLPQTRTLVSKHPLLSAGEEEKLQNLKLSERSSQTASHSSCSSSLSSSSTNSSSSCLVSFAAAMSTRGIGAFGGNHAFSNTLNMNSSSLSVPIGSNEELAEYADANLDEIFDTGKNNGPFSNIRPE